MAGMAGSGGGARLSWRWGTARRAARPLAGLAVAVATCCAGPAPGPAFGQAPMQSFGDLPARPFIDPDVDPYPFDPFLALRTYLGQRLPAGWWARDPVYDAGAFTVVVNIPESWRGNPTAAMLQLCPQPGSTLWQRIAMIELKPFYKKSPWASVTCRR